MVKQVNPGLARLLLSHNQRQYGYVAPLKLAELSAGQQRALDYLERGVSDNQIGLLPEMAKASELEVSELLERLGPYLVTTSSFLPEIPAEEVEVRFSEIVRLLLAGSEDPATAMKRRKQTWVYLNSLGRMGLALARGFAQAGVGGLVTTDQAHVQRAQLGPLGYPKDSVGSSRASVARALIPELAIKPLSRVTDALDGVGVAVLIAQDVLNPRVYQRWLSRDIPHIAAIFDEGGVLVSQLIRPGITPCLGCYELERIQNESDWQLIAPQLDYLERDLEDARSLLFACSLVLQRLLAEVDGSDSAGNPLRLDLKTGVISELEVTKFNCGCH
jgi:hypothetical protein